jgi:hypothetical protein
MKDDAVAADNFKIQNNNRFIVQAIKKCGSQAELARKLQKLSGVKCYPQKVNEWKMRGVIPPYWVKHIAAVLEASPSKVDPLLYS